MFSSIFPLTSFDKKNNRKMHEKKNWKIFMHNLENFDAHLIAAGYTEDFLDDELNGAMKLWKYSLA